MMQGSSHGPPTSSSLSALYPQGLPPSRPMQQLQHLQGNREQGGDSERSKDNFQVSNQLLLMLAAQFKIMSNHNHVQYPVAMNPIFEEYCSSITQWRNVYKLVIIVLSQ